MFEQIQELARSDSRLDGGEKHNRLFLSQWWSQKYNRPLKDPLLLSYTLEELAYEYYLFQETQLTIQDKLETESDKIEEAKDQEAQEWADKMEAEDESAPPDPTLDPANAEWMQQEIEKNKVELGEDFGDDLSIGFGD